MATSTEFSVKSELLQTLKDTLQCSGCKAFPSSNRRIYYQCKNCKIESFFCQKCFLENECCTICCPKDQMTKFKCTGQCGPGRNHNQFGNQFGYRNQPTHCQNCLNAFLPKVTLRESPLVSKLIENLPLYCKFLNNGCSEVMLLDEMIEHESECIFRDIKCFRCEKTIMFKDFDEHQVNRICMPMAPLTQKGAIYKRSKHQFEFVRFASGGRILALDRTFYEAILFKNDIWYFWIYLLGTPEEAKHFCYEIRITKDPKRKISFNGQVQSVDHFFDSLLMKDDVLALPIIVMNKFLDGNSKLNFEVKIRNLKEEAKDDFEESGIDDSD